MVRYTLSLHAFITISVIITMPVNPAKLQKLQEKQGQVRIGGKVSNYHFAVAFLSTCSQNDLLFCTNW